jgi:hypothetical protein
MNWKFWSRGERHEADTDTDDGEVATRPSPAFSTIDARLRQRPAFLDALWRGPVEIDDSPDLPRFSATASDDIAASGDDPNLARKRLALRDALGASQPVIARERFAGRHDALAQLIAAIEQQRVHVVVYGERGIGKTSLVHVFADTAREARYLVIYGSCGTEARFDTMFRAFATKIPMLYHRDVLPTALDNDAQATFDKLLPETEFGPREVSDLFADVVGTRIVLILDEYDRVLDPAFRRDVAELIKNLSDRAARVQLVLTGVAQNLDELVGYAPSIRRNIIGLPMRPLTGGEVKSILALGEGAAGISYSDEAVNMITTMAGGSPYLVRLLGHRAGTAALDDHRVNVDEGHGRIAVERVLTDWNASLPRRIQTILGRDDARAQWPLLVAAARAGSSADGWFSVDDVYTEVAAGIPSATIERDLRHFAHAHELLEVQDGAETRFRYRYPGVSSLLLMSAAMAKLAA